MAAGFGVHPGVRFRIVATKSFPATNAFSGEPGVHVHVRAQRRSAAADAGAAHHGPAIHQRDGRPRAAQQGSCAFTDDSQGSVKIGAERMKFVLN